MAMAETNGTPTSSKTANMTDGTVRASGSSSRRSHRRKRRTYTAWLADKSIKLLVWYALVTIVFRCPSTGGDLSDDSPLVCKGYFRSKDFILPHAQPYYDQYLANHVERAQPYVEKFNTNIYQPGNAVYQRYGAPRVADAQKFGQSQWEKTVKPQLLVARQQASKQYDATLGPQVKKVQDVVQPYYSSAKTSATDIWELEIQPVYRRAAPYAQKAAPYAQSIYNHGHQIATQTVLPQAQYAGGVAWSFWMRQIWPKVRVLYGENVEPQLLRITERLARYKDGKQLQAEIKSMDMTSVVESITSSAETVYSSLSSTITEATESPSSIISEATHEPSASPLEQFEEDLKSWEEICHVAADEGAEHLKEHIAELTDRHAHNQINGTGEALIVQLEETVQSVLTSVKSHIIEIVGEIPDDADDERIAVAHDALISGIRSFGQTIKKRAQAIREWHQSYNVELDDLVDKALESTLETVDGIRELRLSEIGRRYSDKGLPHKMWSKYNGLKKATKLWRDDVEKVVTSNENITNAKRAAEDIESRGMGIAEESAVELARLRDVGKWKATAGDASDDFETKTLPATIERAKKRAVEKAADASDALFGSSESEQGFVESLTSVIAEKASDAVESVTEAVTSTITVEEVAREVSSTAETVLEKAKSSASKVASAASETIIGSESDFSDSATDAASEVKSSASSAASSASEAVIGTKSALSDSVSEAASKASKVVVGSDTALVDSLSSIISGASTIPKSKTLGPKAASIIAAAKKHMKSASTSVTSVVQTGSSVASSVESSVHDSAVSGSDAISSSASSIISAASEAIPDPSDVSSASAKATKKVFGGAMAEVIVNPREPIMDEEIVDEDSTASDISESAGSAASSAAAYLGDATNNLAASASSRYSEAASQASVHYEAAKSVLSVQISGTPEPIHKQMFASAEAAYSDSLAVASQRLQDAIGAAKAANPLAAPTQGAYERISSIASERLAEGISAASAQYQNAKIAVGVEPTPVHQQYLASAQRKYYEGVGLAHEQYSSFIAAASSAVGSTPTTGYQAYVASAQSTYSAALAEAKSSMEAFFAAAAMVTNSPMGRTEAGSIGKQYFAAVKAAQSQLAAASDQASELFFGTSKGNIEHATEAAASAYNDASSAVISAVHGEETPWTEAMASKASENWDALISQASEGIYGTPLPFTDAAVSYADVYAAQATDFVAGQYEAVQAIFSELVIGKEADFKDSVMSRLNSAYSTGAPNLASYASSYAGDSYASASSAIAAVFTPPASLDTFMDQLNGQLDAAVNAASQQFLGTSKGLYESATEAAASVYSDVSSQANEAIYGTDTGYVEAAQASMSDIGASASKAISEALYGTPTGALDGAASVYSSINSVASEQAAAVSSAVSSALYGEEQTYMESMQSQIAEAVANAQSRIAEFGGDASKLAADSVSQASEVVVDAASSVSSAASAATEKIRDEL